MSTLKRIAIFVEGHTELNFVEKLLIEIAGANKVEIRKIDVITNQGEIKKISAHSASHNLDYYVLLVNCRGDARVASEIRDNYPRLSSLGYTLVIGLRDVFPKRHYEIPRIRQAIQKYSPKGSLPVEIFLSILEIESWFIAENTHFLKISPRLTAINIKKYAGVDINKNPAQLSAPAKTLSKIYRVAGKTYNKQQKVVKNTLDALDYLNMYCNPKIHAWFPDFQGLTAKIDNFLS